MPTYYYGSATFLFVPTDGSGKGSNKQFSGSCPTHRRATSEDQALEICKEDAKSKAGYDYRLDSRVSKSIQQKDFDE